MNSYISGKTYRLIDSRRILSTLLTSHLFNGLSKAHVIKYKQYMQSKITQK